jgi:hypothetical protein
MSSCSLSEISTRTIKDIIVLQTEAKHFFFRIN